MLIRMKIVAVAVCVSGCLAGCATQSTIARLEQAGDVRALEELRYSSWTDTTRKAAAEAAERYLRKALQDRKVYAVRVFHERDTITPIGEMPCFICSSSREGYELSETSPKVRGIRGTLDSAGLLTSRPGGLTLIVRVVRYQYGERTNPNIYVHPDIELGARLATMVPRVNYEAHIDGYKVSTNLLKVLGTPLRENILRALSLNPKVVDESSW
jgi:hypothetical protein